MSQVIKLAELAKCANMAAQENFTDRDYFLGRFVAGNSDRTLPEAIKVDGVSVFMCTAGEAEVTINFKTVRLCVGSLMVLSPNDLVEIAGSSSVTMEGYALFLPIEFLKQFSLDINTLNYRDIRFDASPVIELDDERRRLFEGYFSLLELNVATNRERSVYTRNVSRSLVGAMIYQIMAFAHTHQPDVSEEATAAQSGSGRRSYYVRDFMSHLQQDFRQHRSVGHYADKLFISAKYLSLIIKEATGRTATEWIDHFVILEAKNLLRYSERNIQQIAYDLNFHNQSAFGKYFKHLTGMSPSEFRKT